MTRHARISDRGTISSGREEKVWPGKQCDEIFLEVVQISAPPDYRRRMNMVSWWAKYAGQTVVVAVHSRSAPTFSEWESYLGHVREVLALHPGLEGVVGLAVTDGGSPSFAQRARLVSVSGSATPTGVVLTGSVLVRLAVNALMVFGYKLRVFRPEQMSIACDYLGIPAEARAPLREEIRAQAKVLSSCRAAEGLVLDRVEVKG